MIIIVRQLIVLAISAFILSVGGVSFAQSPPFFSLLGDVPAMQGLYEVPEAHMVFDKPEGRIAELVIMMDGVTPDQVSRYYQNALPQFGWYGQGEGQFIRDGELLSLQFENSKMMKISVSPRSD